MKWSAGILGQFPLTEERMIEATSGRDDNEQYFPFTAFDVYGAQSVGLGVFDNNKAAYNCYKSVGFKETGECVNYEIGGNTWTDVEMEISR